MTTERIVRTAAFDSNVCPYSLITGCIACVFTVVGLLLLPFWIIFGWDISRRQLESMECILTTKALRVKYGRWFLVEKTIPLEKITDLGVYQGPLMRRFGIFMLRVETAGQATPGAVVSLLGIIRPKEFREAVLFQRDQLSESPTPEIRQEPGSAAEVLQDIREVLLRIERHLSR